MSKISEAMKRSRRERGDNGEAHLGTADSRVRSARPHHRVVDPEQYHALASEIVLALPSASSRVVMFASAVREEGTSTVAAEFAATLASTAEQPVLLIDANLRHPVLHTMFGVARDPGLADHILNDVPLSECLRETDVPHLTVLPVGRRAVAPPRVFSDPRMKRLLKDVRGRFAYVILDMAALVQYSEGFQLSRDVDGVVIVIKAGRTKRELVEHATELLKDAGARVLGIVLNRRRYYIPKFIYERL